MLFLKLAIARDARDKSHYVSSILGMDNLINERRYILRKNEESDSEGR